MSTTLNGIDDKVRALEGTNKSTPIAMSELDSRINNLSGNNVGYFEEFPQTSNYIKKVININLPKHKISIFVMAGNKINRFFFNITGNTTVSTTTSSDKNDYMKVTRNNNTVTVEINTKYSYQQINAAVLLVNHD